LRGVSSHIRVRSIVGRFLEHSRIFYFENGGQPEVYLGSADWMQRNLYERVEVLFPLKDPSLKRRITAEVLAAYLEDTRTARLLGPDGRFTRPRLGRNGHGVSVQEKLMRTAQLPAARPSGRAGQAGDGALPAPVLPAGKPEPDEGADSMSHDTFSVVV
jgi:polyphosphate kinase